MSFAPIIIGTKKFPSTPGIDRDEEQEQHDRAVGGERLVVLVQFQDRPGRGEQVEPDEPGGERRRTTKKTASDDQVQDADPLVVDGEQPRQPPVLVVQVVDLRRDLVRVGPVAGCSRGPVRPATPGRVGVVVVGLTSCALLPSWACRSASGRAVPGLGRVGRGTDRGRELVGPPRQVARLAGS